MVADRPAAQADEWFCERADRPRSIPVDRSPVSSVIALWAQVALLGRRGAWQRVADAALSAMMLGGVLAVPLACVMALVTLWLPGGTPLHQTGAHLLGFAIVWFALAVCGAHFQPRKQENA
jgi:hypothetical protein